MPTCEEDPGCVTLSVKRKSNKKDLAVRMTAQAPYPGQTSFLFGCVSPKGQLVSDATMLEVRVPKTEKEEKVSFRLKPKPESGALRKRLFATADDVCASWALLDVNPIVLESRKQEADDATLVYHAVPTWLAARLGRTELTADD